MNEITGDSLVTKCNTEMYRKGWDTIFNKSLELYTDPSIEKLQEQNKAQEIIGNNQVILLNKAMCDNCHEVIHSKSVHDYNTCSCGDLSVDGGLSYLKRNFGKHGYTELSYSVDADCIEEIRKYFTWGSYGKLGNEPKKLILLKDMSDSHINAILDTQYHIRGTKVEKFFQMEMKYRKDNDLDACNEY